MADVFISYARADILAARQVAGLLSERGYSVWWDRDLLPHEGFRSTIERELETSKAVIVIWSLKSVQSQFVVDEASFAQQSQKLIQVRINDVPAPLGFRQGQIASLDRASDYRQSFETVIRSVAVLAGREVGEAPVYPRTWIQRAIKGIPKVLLSGRVLYSALIAFVAITTFLFINESWLHLAIGSNAKNQKDTAPLIPIEKGLADDEISRRTLRCDQLAAHYLDGTKPVGVRGLAIDQVATHSAEAIDACRKALAANPAQKSILARMYFNMSRAYYSNNQASSGNPFALRAAELGHPRAFMMIGIRSTQGDSMPQDFSVAREWFEKGVEAGEPSARSAMAQFMRMGLAQNTTGMQLPESVYQANLDSAVLGYGRAWYNVGVYRLTGYGVKRSQLEAFAAFQSSIKDLPEVMPLAHTELGWMSERGIGTSVDGHQAVAYYTKGLQYGHSVSALALARLYATGTFVPKNINLAKANAAQALSMIGNTVDRDAVWSFARNEDMDQLVARAILDLRTAAVEANDSDFLAQTQKLEEAYLGRRLPMHVFIQCTKPELIKKVEWCYGYWADKPRPSLHSS